MCCLYIFMFYLACVCNTNGTFEGRNNCDKRSGDCDKSPGCEKQYAGKDCGLCNGAFGFHGSFPVCNRKSSSEFFFSFKKMPLFMITLNLKQLTLLPSLLAAKVHL